jgi:hypothetical protein
LDDKFPGPIDNNRIIYNLASFHNDGDIDKQENIVIKIDTEVKDDLKIVNKDIWDYLHGLYKGGPPIKVDIISPDENNEKKIIEIYLKDLKCIFLPKRNEFNETSIEGITLKPLFYSIKDNLNDLKAKIARIGYNESDINKIRLWKLNEKYSFKDFINFLKTIADTSDNEISGKIIYLECMALF